jgi:hypothetical protein
MPDSDARYLSMLGGAFICAPLGSQEEELIEQALRLACQRLGVDCRKLVEELGADRG